MKKITTDLAFVLVFFFAINTRISAQNIVNSDFINQVNTAFSGLDKSRVPNGLLLDYAMELADLNSYNGTLTDSNKLSKGILRDIYTTVVLSAVHTNAGGLWHPDYIDSIWQLQRQPGIITLGGVYYNYSRLKDNAATAGLVTVSSNRLYDKYVNGTWQNPYQTQAVFAMSPALNFYSGRSFSVTMPANLWLTNSVGSADGISVDFADGAGYHIIAAGQSINLSYADTGTKAWVFRLSLANGTYLYSHNTRQ